MQTAWRTDSVPLSVALNECKKYCCADEPNRDPGDFEFINDMVTLLLVKLEDRLPNWREHMDVTARWFPRDVNFVLRVSSRYDRCYAEASLSCVNRYRGDRSMWLTVVLPDVYNDYDLSKYYANYISWVDTVTSCFIRSQETTPKELDDLFLPGSFGTTQKEN